MVKKSVIVAILMTFLFVALLFTIIPVLGPPSQPYDPFFDYNQDGKVGPADFAYFSTIFGSQGTYTTLASLAYDSGWINITDKCGQYFNMTHNLNSTDLIVDITGKATIDGGVHQKYLGGAGRVSGWYKMYDGAIPGSVIQTFDGGYAIAGGASLIKTDSVGTVEWNNTYRGTDNIYSVNQVSDGGYALAGYTSSFGAGGADVWLARTDLHGNTMWNITYGGSNDDCAYSVASSPNSFELVIAGYTGSYGAGGSDFLLVGFWGNNILWNQTYGGAGDDKAYSVVRTSDLGYVLAGEGFANLVKTDWNGNVQWNRTYGGQARAVVQTSDGGYALAGLYDNKPWIAKTDTGGNLQWNKTYGYSATRTNSIVQTSDGGYLLPITFMSMFNQEIALIKTDANGNVQWNRYYYYPHTIMGDPYGTVNSAIETNDGGYAFVGTASSHALVAKTSVEPGLAWTGSDVNNITLYRGATDEYWNFVRVQIWKTKTGP
jgi:hypothetical protein